MTYDEKVRWLRRYRDALKLEVELRQELEAQRARACKTTAALTGMPGGGGDGQALPRAVESIVAAQQELQAQINLCGATRREVVAALDQVTDARTMRSCAGGICWGSVGRTLLWICTSNCAGSTAAIAALYLN